MIEDKTFLTEENVGSSSGSSNNTVSVQSSSDGTALQAATIKVSPTSLSFSGNYSASCNGTKISISATTSWTASVVKNGNYTWCSLSKANNASNGSTSITGYGNNSFYIVAQKNTGTTRTATINVTTGSSGLYNSVIVTQAPQNILALQYTGYTLASYNPNDSYAASDFTNVSGNCKYYTYAADDSGNSYSWIVSAGTWSGTASSSWSKISLKVTNNLGSTSSRIGYLKITDDDPYFPTYKLYKVTQKASPYFWAAYIGVRPYITSGANLTNFVLNPSTSTWGGKVNMVFNSSTDSQILTAFHLETGVTYTAKTFFNRVSGQRPTPRLDYVMASGYGNTVTASTFTNGIKMSALTPGGYMFIKGYQNRVSFNGTVHVSTARFPITSVSSADSFFNAFPAANFTPNQIRIYPYDQDSNHDINVPTGIKYGVKGQKQYSWYYNIFDSQTTPYKGEGPSYYTTAKTLTITAERLGYEPIERTINCESIEPGRLGIIEHIYPTQKTGLVATVDLINELFPKFKIDAAFGNITSLSEERYDSSTAFIDTMVNPNSGSPFLLYIDSDSGNTMDDLSLPDSRVYLMSDIIDYKDSYAQDGIGYNSPGNLGQSSNGVIFPDVNGVSIMTDYQYNNDDTYCNTCTSKTNYCESAFTCPYGVVLSADTNGNKTLENIRNCVSCGRCDVHYLCAHTVLRTHHGRPIVGPVTWLDVDMLDVANDVLEANDNLIYLVCDSEYTMYLDFKKLNPNIVKVKDCSNSAIDDFPFNGKNGILYYKNGKLIGQRFDEESIQEDIYNDIAALGGGNSIDIQSFSSQSDFDEWFEGSLGDNMIVIITHSSSATGKLMEKYIRDLCCSDFSKNLPPDICIVDSDYVTKINGHTLKDLRIETLPVTLYMDGGGGITNQVQGLHSKNEIIQYANYIERESSENCHNYKEYVDLGLPSGTLWAKCNVGASKESDYGGYYQWGGTVDYTSTAKTCNWTTYPYGSGSTSLTKYCTDDTYGIYDNRSELEKSDDIANRIMTGAWHMPTDAQIAELISATTSEWTTVDNIKGRRFTSKFNGNSIFIPAAGRRLNNALYDVGGECYLWTNSMYTKSQDSAYSLRCYLGSAYASNNFRHNGLSARGVLF